MSVVHLNDIRQVGQFEPVLLGTGVAPIADLLRVLVGADFDGWVSVEEASNMGSDGFEPAIQYAERAWKDAGGVSRYEPAQN